MKQNNKHISKFLSLVLRHQPETINLTLDANGWANIDELLSKMDPKFRGISFEDIKAIIASNDKQRFTFNEDETKIRANQGHSVAIDLKLSPSTPPEYLFHGTVEKFMESIKSIGLVKGSRQHVHLSEDLTTATTVGNRRGKAILLKVKAHEMSLKGYDFYLSKNNVWLTDAVPCEYIEF